MEKADKLKGLVLGATGAVGRELVNELVKSNNWSEVTVIVRRKLEEWDKFSDAEKSKLKIIQQENLDNLQDLSKWNFTGVSTVFCCLGTQQKYGKDNFIKVDRTYPGYGGQLAVHFKIPHYSLVTSIGSNSSSWFFYPKTKGQVEDDLKAMNLPHLSILRPGGLLERRNDERFGEKIGAWIPFFPKIQVKDVAKALRIEAELQNKTPHSQKVLIYENADVQQIADTGKYPEKAKL